MNCNWIVAKQDLSMHCQRCGKSYSPKTPAPIDIYLAITKAFIEDHKHCPEQNSLSNQ